MDLKIKKANRSFEIEGFFSAILFSWNDQFQFIGESHDFWEIVFVSDGMVRVTEDEKVYTLKKNDIILHRPLEFHRIGSAGGTSPQGMITSFRTVGNLPERLGNGVFSLGDEDAVEYRKVFERIHSFFHRKTTDPYAGQMACALLTAFLIRLGSTEPTAARIPHTASEEEYRKAALAMSRAVCQNSSLSDVAAHCNISVSYLKLLFQKYAGISPKSYYNNLRAQYAIKRLKAGASSIEIATEMNFSSPNYFSTFFQKQTGKTPSAYRRELP